MVPPKAVHGSSMLIAERNPERVALFDVYVATLFKYLREYWDSPAAVTSRASDMLLESKHRFQNEIFGPVEATVWERWNEHFLQQILATASLNPGKRVLVLVGAEHAYWLRAALAAQMDNGNFTLLDAEQLVAELGD